MLHILKWHNVISKQQFKNQWINASRDLNSSFLEENIFGEENVGIDGINRSSSYPSTMDDIVDDMTQRESNQKSIGPIDRFIILPSPLPLPLPSPSPPPLSRSLVREIVGHFQSVSSFLERFWKYKNGMEWKGEVAKVGLSLLTADHGTFAGMLRLLSNHGIRCR